MKTSIGTFTDLNGKVIEIENREHLDKQIETAAYTLELNRDYHPMLTEEMLEKIRAYWKNRLDCLLLIKEESSKTLFQHWQAGRIGGFGSFQSALLKAYQVADSTNAAKLKAAFPEWFVNPYQL